MKVLVTGGGGFLGCYIVEMLQKRGYLVRAFGRRPQPILESRGIEFIRGDISFSDDVDKAVCGSDAVFHVAGRAGLDMDYQAYYNTHVVGTKNVVEACQRHRVQRLVFTSTPAVVFNGQDLSGGDESLPYQFDFPWYYAQTKAMAEKYVLEHNSPRLKTVALRPHLLLGEGDPHLMPQILQCAKNRKLQIVGEGNNRVDITFVANAAHAHLLAFDALEQGKIGGKAYFIGQERPIVLWEFIGSVLERLKLPALERRISFKKAYQMGYMTESFYRMFRRSKMPPMTRALAVALSKDHYFSHERARVDFGYVPQVTIEQGLDGLIHALRWQLKVLWKR
jgi:nucleoside-diphosphate-sugar epimerase